MVLSLPRGNHIFTVILYIIQYNLSILLNNYCTIRINFQNKHIQSDNRIKTGKYNKKERRHKSSLFVSALTYFPGTLPSKYLRHR